MLTQPILMPDPQDAGTVQISGLPLFGPSGPTKEDGYQLLLGDCGVIAFLKGWAVQDPTSIPRVITTLANGDYEVQVVQGLQSTVWEISPDYSTAWQAPPSNGNWMVALEKVVAMHNGGYYHGVLGVHSGIDGIAPFQVCNVFGFTDYGIGGSQIPTDGPSLVTYLQGELTKHRVVVVGTDSQTIPSLIANHYYYLISVTQLNGAWQISLGSPWGSFYDVTISPADFLSAFQEVSSQKLEPTSTPSLLPPPAPVTLPAPQATILATTATDSSANPRTTLAFRVPQGTPITFTLSSLGGATAILRQTMQPDQTVPLNSTFTITPATSTMLTFLVTSSDKRVASAILLIGLK